MIKRLVKKAIVDWFHIYWYNSPSTWLKNTFLGYRILQCPLDLQIYQEIIYKIRPKYILQTGIHEGGSLLYFASILDLIKADPLVLVVGVDIKLTEKAKTLQHPRIRLVEGDSTAAATVDKIKSYLPCPKGFVVLDSDHSATHVEKEINIYKEFVENGSYLVVEDTNINGRPVFKKFGPGPYEAVEKFLKKEDRFVCDDALWSRNLFSFHQGGWLKRIR